MFIVKGIETKADTTASDMTCMAHNNVLIPIIYSSGVWDANNFAH